MSVRLSVSSACTLRFERPSAGQIAQLVRAGRIILRRLFEPQGHQVLEVGNAPWCPSRERVLGRLVIAECLQPAPPAWQHRSELLDGLSH